MEGSFLVRIPLQLNRDVPFWCSFGCGGYPGILLEDVDVERILLDYCSVMDKGSLLWWMDCGALWLFVGFGGFDDALTWHGKGPWDHRGQVKPAVCVCDAGFRLSLNFTNTLRY